MEKLSTILAVLDPRAESQHAFRRCVEIAGRTGASAVLVVCDYIEALSRTVFADEEEVRKARDEYLESHEKWLDGFASKAREAGVEARTHVAWKRPAFEAILEAAEKFEAGLIVKAASDDSLAERLLIGAADWDLVRNSPQPLWLVKQPAAAAQGDWIVAVDPAHPDEKHVGLDRKLLRTGRFLSGPLKAELHVFHAFAPPAMVLPTGGTGAAVPAPSTIPGDTEAMLDERRKTVAELAAAFDIPDESVHVEVGDTVVQLGREVEERGASLVIAGAVSRGMLERLVLGNTAEKLLGRIDCDILVVKPDSFPAEPGDGNNK